jgi:hypothetical protein
VPGSRCGTGTVSINATSGTGTTIDWYDASSGGNLVGTGKPFTTPSINTTTTYYAQVRNTTTGCTSASRVAVTATINALPAVAVTAASSDVCAGTSTTLTASGAVSYVWSPTTGLSSGVGASVTASPANSTTYTVTGTGANGCTNTASVTVNVLPAALGGNITPAISTVCSGENSGTLSLENYNDNIVRWESSTNGGVTWSPIANTSPTLTYSNLTQSTVYRVRVENGICQGYSTTAVVSVIPPYPPTATVYVAIWRFTDRRHI